MILQQRIIMTLLHIIMNNYNLIHTIISVFKYASITYDDTIKYYHKQLLILYIIIILTELYTVELITLLFIINSYCNLITKPHNFYKLTAT